MFLGAALLRRRGDRGGYGSVGDGGCNPFNRTLYAKLGRSRPQQVRAQQEIIPFVALSLDQYSASGLHFDDAPRLLLGCVLGIFGLKHIPCTTSDS